MKRSIFVASGSALLMVLTVGLAVPMAAAPPELRITDMDAARAYFEDSGSGDWVLFGEVSYVFADSVKYRDGTRSRPHTDVDVWLTACPPPPADPDDPADPCIDLRGTTNLADMLDAATFTEMTEASITGVTVHLSGPSGNIATVEANLDWEAVGPIYGLREIEPAVSTLVGKQRDATASGTFEVVSATGPFATFVNSYSAFHYALIQNYNQVYHGG